MSKLRFGLTLPPSANHSYVQVLTKSGRRMPVPSKATKHWRQTAGLIARQQAQRQGWTTPEPGTPVVVEYTIYWPDRRRRDPSNLEKHLLDAIQCVTGDDQWVMPRCMGYHLDREAPGVEVACSTGNKTGNIEPAVRHGAG